MELREAEALGAKDDHDRCVRNVDPDLDHRRRHKDVDLTARETAHDRIAFFRRHTTVHHSEPKAAQFLLAEILRGGDRARDVVAALLGGIDPRRDDESLLAARDCEPDAFPDLWELLRCSQVRDDRLPSKGQLVDH